MSSVRSNLGVVRPAVRIVLILALLTAFLVVLRPWSAARKLVEPRETESFSVTADERHGIERGTPVTISGFEVGTVAEIELADDGRGVRLEFEIAREYWDRARARRRIRIVPPLLQPPFTPAKISLTESETPARDWFVEVDESGSLDDLRRAIASLSAMLAAAERGETGLIGPVLGEKGAGDAVGLVADLRGTVEATTKLAVMLEERIRRHDDQLTRAIESYAERADGIEAQGKTMFVNLQSLVVETRGLVADLRTTCQGLGSVDLPDLVGRQERRLADLENEALEILSASRRAVHQITLLMDGMRRSWLFGGAFAGDLRYEDLDTTIRAGTDAGR